MIRNYRRRRKAATQEEVIAAIKSVTEQAGGKRVFMRQFLAKSRLQRHDVHKHFASWNTALKAAGIELSPRERLFVETEELLADWGAVARKLQRPPPSGLYDVHGKYCPRTPQLRFGSWLNVRQAFREFAEGKEEWKDVLEKMKESGNQEIRNKAWKGGVGFQGSGQSMRRMMRVGRPREDRPIYGEPLDVPGLRNAPISENGVILVFGMLAAQLGFHIQAVRTAFPDCDALRQVGGGVAECDD